jgi:hypothetical protein
LCHAVNTACEFIGQADIDAMKDKGAVMLQQERYEDLKFVLAELELISGTEERIATCMTDLNTRMGDPKGTHVWCVCTNVVVTKVDMLKNVAYIVLALACMQFVILAMALQLMGIDVRTVAGELTGAPATVMDQGGAGQKIIC